MTSRTEAVADMNLAELESRALRATSLLKAMANPVRLLVLCQLAEGEKSVGELEGVVDVSQSALSQHLGLLRQRKLVKSRRAGQTIFYSIDGTEAPALLAALYQVYCSQGPLVRRPRNGRRQAA
jgi:DNA-binding transcriptional ArsR family regulator